MSAAEITRALAATAAANTTSIEATAHTVLTTYQQDGLVYGAGAGHSIAMVIEMFYRAGGLAFTRPLFDPEILPLSGAERSTVAERMPGRGDRLVERSTVGPADTVVVYSNTGVNPYPVEVAAAARRRGASVVAVTSVDVSAGTPHRGAGRLYEFADVVLDTKTPPGDVSLPALQPCTAPMSSLAATLLWNLVLERVRHLDPTVPLWRSANVPGNDRFNEEWLARYQVRIPELS